MKHSELDHEKAEVAMAVNLQFMLDRYCLGFKVLSRKNGVIRAENIETGELYEITVKVFDDDSTEQKFVEGEYYEAIDPKDHNAVWRFEVLNRTLTFMELREYGKHRASHVRIEKDEDGNEFCYPQGKFKHCPILKAIHKAKQ